MGQSEGHQCHTSIRAAWVSVSPPRPLTLALTVLVKEEEEEGVHDGDEDPTPEGDAAGWQGGALDVCPSAERGHGGGLGVPVGRLTGRLRAG